MLLHVSMVTGRPGRARTGAGAGVLRPAVADVPDLQGVATRGPGRRLPPARRWAISACSTSPSRPAPKDSPPRPSSSRSPAPPRSGPGPTSGCVPLAGSHVLVAGCASYHAAVDHHLGALAASLGDTSGGRGTLPRRGSPARATRGRRLGTAVRAGPGRPVSHRTRDDRATSSASSTGSGTSGSREPTPSCPTPRVCGTSRSLIGSPGTRRPRLHPARRGAAPRRR